MFRQRFNYWTCSKFADFVRGEKKPFALEWDKWDEWEQEQKKNRPIRFWLSDTFLKYLQDIVYYPYDTYRSIKFYVRNRWIDKTHYLRTGLKPGDYYDLDTRIIHGLFNELVDLVEVEYAHLSKWSNNKKYKFKNGRCLEAAYDYFDWATNLRYDENSGTSPEDSHYGELTHQAKDAIKIKELYEWWTKIRSSRDPHKESGWDVNFESKDKKAKDKSFEKLIKLEEKYEKEEEKMLISLIKIRKSLWT